MGQGSRWRRMIAGLAGALLALGAGTVGAQPAEPARGPLVNLRVELRQAEAQRQSERGAGVAVSERGVAIGAGVQERGGERGVRQQLLVLNGGRATLRLGQARPLQWLQAVRVAPPSPGSSGIAWVPGTVWVDAGQGLTVRPLWPGGAAPVTVEVAAESAGLGAPGFGREPPRGAQLLTTLQLPLGDWVTVAESADAQQQDGRGLLSGRGSEDEHRLVLQMRVTAP